MIQTLFGNAEENKVGLFDRMKQAVTRTRENLAERIEEVVSFGKEIDGNTLDEDHWSPYKGRTTDDVGQHDPDGHLRPHSGSDGHRDLDARPGGARINRHTAAERQRPLAKA